MTWTKLSGGFADRPALLSVPRGVRFLHVEALLWSNTHGQDGSIPHYVLGRITDEPEPHKAAEALVTAGIWKETAAGWLIVDSLDDQPSAEDEAKKHELWAKQKRRQRQHRSGVHDLCDPRYCQQSRVSTVDKGADSTVESSHNRTDTHPTPPAPKTRGHGSGAGGERSRLEGARSAPAEGKEHPPGTCDTHYQELPCIGCAADRKAGDKDNPQSEPIKAIHRMASILGVEPTPCEDDDDTDLDIYLRRGGLDFGAYTNTNTGATHITIWADRTDDDDTWPEDKPLPDEPFHASALKVHEVGTRDYRTGAAVNIAEAWREAIDRVLNTRQAETYWKNEEVTTT